MKTYHLTLPIIGLLAGTRALAGAGLVSWAAGCGFAVQIRLLDVEGFAGDLSDEDHALLVLVSESGTAGRSTGRGRRAGPLEGAATR